jgi:hypothetical protein
LPLAAKNVTICAKIERKTDFKAYQTARNQEKSIAVLEQIRSSKRGG